MGRFLLSVGAFAAVSALLAGSVAVRADDQNCQDVELPKISLGAIGAKAVRSYFFRNGSETKDCPNSSDKCRARSFLVSGDEIALGRTNGAFVCAQFVDAKFDWHSGWLLAADVVSPAPVALADWIGSWKLAGRRGGAEAKITIKPASEAGALSIEGNASWRGSDPGNVNVGEVEGVAVPNRADLSFTMNGGETLPVDQGEGCKIWIGRLRRQLLVIDNLSCGGLSVSFSGVYTRR